MPALEALHGAGYGIAAVVTQPDKPVGRGLKTEAPAVKKKAEELGLSVLQPATLKDSPSQSQRTVLERLKSFHAEVAVCVAYGKIIPKSVLDIFPRGILNIHPSLLPKYRGPSPIQAAILNGDAETGVTIMLLDEEMDRGPVLTRNTYHITRSTTGSELSCALAQEGAKLLVEILPKYLAGKITPQPQAHGQTTYTKMLTREDGKIDWNKPAEYVERMVRAYDLWPGTWSSWNGKRLKILRASMGKGTDNASLPLDGGGKVGVQAQTVLAVSCNPGSIIVELLQLEGKKPMSGAEFMRGHPAVIGAYLLQ